MTLSSYHFFFSSRRRHTRYIGDWSSDVCSSDLMGNGPAGVVAALGPQVEGVDEGQRVVVSNNVSCGNCKYCRIGRETLCSGLNNHRGGMIGAHRDGGYAEFVCVPARNLVPLPDTVSFEQA